MPQPRNSLTEQYWDAPTPHSLLPLYTNNFKNQSGLLYK
ncbi:hypothetical protein GXM_06533 [Nostoc sphaeroides CCNUC1]|uniref:Uncharacterized protein n=1 Tax=Nostoc sphaeroides CCNUC1 TaxID=2653204 RepID=A0A5P8WAV8_9NOSO|nr:hypothetical protein GXM_06533 [Nostoc sphaeroides CCNUC1]